MDCSLGEHLRARNRPGSEPGRMAPEFYSLTHRKHSRRGTRHLRRNRSTDSGVPVDEVFFAITPVSDSFELHFCSHATDLCALLQSELRALDSAKPVR